MDRVERLSRSGTAGTSIASLILLVSVFNSYNYFLTSLLDWVFVYAGIRQARRVFFSFLYSFYLFVDKNAENFRCFGVSFLNDIKLRISTSEQPFILYFFVQKIRERCGQL